MKDTHVKIYHTYFRKKKSKTLMTDTGSFWFSIPSLYIQLKNSPLMPGFLNYSKEKQIKTRSGNGGRLTNFPDKFKHKTKYLQTEVKNTSETMHGY